MSRVVFGPMKSRESAFVLIGLFITVVAFWPELISESPHVLLLLVCVILSSGFAVQVSSLDRELLLGVGSVVIATLSTRVPAPGLLTAWLWGGLVGRWVAVGDLRRALKNCLTLLPGGIVMLAFLHWAASSELDANNMIIEQSWRNDLFASGMIFIGLVLYLAGTIFASTLWMRLRFSTKVRRALGALSWGRIIALLLFAFAFSLGTRFGAELLVNYGVQSDLVVSETIIISLVSLGGMGLAGVSRRAVANRQLQGLIAIGASLPWGLRSTPEAMVARAVAMVLPDFLISTTDVEAIPGKNVDYLISRELQESPSPFRVIVRRRLFRRAFSTTDRELLDAAVAIADRELGTRRTVDFLSEQAFIDPLTGILNFGGLQRALKAFFKRSEIDRIPVALIYIDIDDFKSVNDQFGHEVGNRVLRSVASRLQQVVRRGDVVARPGGDEFVILISGEKAREYAERVALRLDAAMTDPINIGAQKVGLRVSHGISYSGPGGQDIDTLIHEADKRMYAARGRQLDDVDVPRVPPPEDPDKR